MSKNGGKRFISIRTRLFLQVGFVILFAIAFILVLNNFLLPGIYTGNEKRAMKETYLIIDGIDRSDSESYSHKICMTSKKYQVFPLLAAGSVSFLFLIP